MISFVNIFQCGFRTLSVSQQFAVPKSHSVSCSEQREACKIKAFEASELVKQDQQASKATEGDQTESVKQPAERPNSNPDWSSSVLFSCWRSSRCWRAISIWISKMDSVSKPAD